MPYEAENQNGYDSSRDFDFDYLLAVMEAQKRENESRERYEAEQRALEELGDDSGELDRARRFASQVYSDDGMQRYISYNVPSESERETQFDNLDNDYASQTQDFGAQYEDARMSREAQRQRKAEEFKAKLAAFEAEFRQYQADMQRYDDEDMADMEQYNQNMQDAYDAYIDKFNELKEEAKVDEERARREAMRERRYRRWEFEQSLPENLRDDDSFGFGY